MNKQVYDEFINAVDVVCAQCIATDGDMCNTCPVRQTIDKLKKQIK